MNNDPKLKIYPGMLQYIIESTGYTLKNVADLIDDSVKNILSIYCDAYIPANFSSELQLVKLYHIILESNINRHPPPSNFIFQRKKGVSS